MCSSPVPSITFMMAYNAVSEHFTTWKQPEALKDTPKVVKPGAIIVLNGSADKDGKPIEWDHVTKMIKAGETPYT